MGGWWISDLWSGVNGPVLVVSWLVWVVASITLHELAHGWAAVRLGDDTPIRAGHMTWNPLVHMGPYSLIALLLIGIAWGAMPVDPSRLKGKHADTLVTLAGPLMNLGLGLVALIGLVFWLPLAEGHVLSSVTISEPLKTNMYIFLKSGAFLNFVLMLFNLLMNVWPAFRRMMQSENGQWIGLGIFIIFFVFVIDILVGLSGAFVELFTEIVQGLLFPSMK